MLSWNNSDDEMIDNCDGNDICSSSFMFKISVSGQCSLTFCSFFFIAAIAELLDNAVDEVCSIHLNLSCISFKIS